VRSSTPQMSRRQQAKEIHGRKPFGNDASAPHLRNTCPDVQTAIPTQVLSKMSGKTRVKRDTSVFYLQNADLVVRSAVPT
ncbi:hypothetical protein HAX54_048234, partial [Datura stramonium]|nr:hypothetical protein [Datura stramonium]